jgi:aquaporin Z
MNPTPTFGPDLVGRTVTGYWVDVSGPLAGAVVAVGLAYVLRGKGGGRAGSAAAQGDLHRQVQDPGGA